MFRHSQQHESQPNQNSIVSVHSFEKTSICCVWCSYIKGLVHIQNNIYSPPCHQKCSCLSFFSWKEIKVFEENIPGFFSIKGTSIGINELKVQIAFSVQLQRALHDPSWGIKVLSSEKIGHFLKKFNLKYFLTPNAHLGLALRCAPTTSNIM